MPNNFIVNTGYPIYGDYVLGQATVDNIGNWKKEYQVYFYQTDEIKNDIKEFPKRFATDKEYPFGY